MILPTKGIPPRSALLSVGADILRLLVDSKTVSRLWDEMRQDTAEAPEITFDWFVLSLDLLFVLGAVELDRGRIRRAAVAVASETQP